MEVDRAYTEEGFLCHSERSFDLKCRRTIRKRKTDKELGENNRGGSRNGKKNLKTGEGNSWNWVCWLCCVEALCLEVE
jgi:ribosomal protein L19E